MLRWPTRDVGDQDVSWLELYVDFFISTQTTAPVNMRNTECRGTSYLLPDLCEAAQAHLGNVGDAMRVFTKCCRMFLNVFNVPFFPAGCCDRVRSVAMLGFSRPMAGLLGRPLFVSGVQPLRFLRKAFLGHRMHGRNLAFQHDLGHRSEPLCRPTLDFSTFDASLCYDKVRAWRRMYGHDASLDGRVAWRDG